jgi:hypothetical protein
MKSETGERVAHLRAQTVRACKCVSAHWPDWKFRRPLLGEQAVEVAWLLLLATLWSGSYTLIKVAVQTIPPMSILAGRVSVAAIGSATSPPAAA